ncbi:hypothetical protein WJX75_009344 [Coccomyxa subellipsoidea]|uniref:Uncharacterized protein n=1 Tax=Coccomyxa subellipsoidea TaxID=248742 RepID=A0ABR2YBQ4_9CHLO
MIYYITGPSMMTLPLCGNHPPTQLKPASITCQHAHARSYPRKMEPQPLRLLPCSNMVLPCTASRSFQEATTPTGARQKVSPGPSTRQEWQWNATLSISPPLWSPRRWCPPRSARPKRAAALKCEEQLCEYMNKENIDGEPQQQSVRQRLGYQ